MAVPRDWLEDTIKGGSATGLVVGLLVGLIWFALATMAVMSALGGDGLFGADPLGDLATLALGVVFLATGANIAFSGIFTWRQRRAGRKSGGSNGMAGEELVERGLDRGSLWAIGTVSVFGLAIVTMDLQLVVDLTSGEMAVSFGSLVSVVFLTVFGGFLLGAGVRGWGRRRRRAASDAP
jgi:hypothetical protein